MVEGFPTKELRMNDVVLFGCLLALSCVALICFFFFNVYRGVHDSLANAAIGAVYNFRYFQPMSGDYERFLAKVTKIRKLTNAEISRLNWSSDYRAYDKEFHRSPTLVTCMMGDGSFRQFYAERSDMCKRTAVGNLLFKAGFAHLF
jgi:hypothetical protein